MVLEINTQALLYNEQEITHHLKSISPESRFIVKDLVYYPYMFFEHSFERKNPISPLKGNIGSTVDAISGIASMVDKTPNFIKNTIAANKVLPSQLDEEEARLIADNHLFRVVSSKIKVLMTPKVKLINQELFYRPYWIVEGSRKNKKSYSLIVDSISGAFHPLGSS